MPTKPSKTLQTFDNPQPKRDYIIAIEIPEFTCLCPKTGQPDFATLYLQYVPDRTCIELKSLKLYFWSYRDEGAFHEDVTNAILDDLVAATQPRYMRLRAKFHVRGGLYTTVFAEHRAPGWTPPPPPPDYLPHWSPSPGSMGPSEAAAPAAAAPGAQPAGPQHVHGTADSQTAAPAPAHREADEPVDHAVFVGVDLGTTGCRTVAVNRKGDLLAHAAAITPAPLRNQDQVTQDPTQWWRALNTSLSALLTKIDAGRVRAIAVDGTSGTLLLCDETGRPITPALMYNDGRALAQAELIAERAGPHCGAQGPSSSLAKLLWLQAKHMDTKARYALHQADWIVGRLTGLWGYSDYNNCLKLGFDPQALQWPQWLVQLGANTRLMPTVYAPGQEIGRIRRKVAESFGLPADTCVVAGTTDGVAAFMAAGAHSPGQAVTSLGTTLGLKLVSNTPVFSPQHGVYSHRLGRLWLAGGNSNAGGATLLQYFDTAQMRELTPQLDPENFTKLDYYPLPQVGERFPVNDPKMAPRLEPLPADSVTFFQGMLEGIAHIEAKGYQLLAQLGAPALTQVLTTGGGSVNPAWLRIRERILGVETKTARFGMAAYGTALLAAGVVAKAFATQERTGTGG